MRAPGPLIALLAAAGCQSPAPRLSSQHVIFAARSDLGEPVAGAKIWAGGSELGETGEDGRLEIDMSAEEGTRIRTAARCPDGHLDPSEDTRLILRSFEGVGSRDHLEVSFECPRAHRRAVVLIRAGGFVDLPVLFDGDEVARTDANGNAHLVLTAAPHTSFTVALSTEERERMKPKNPFASYTLGLEDDVFVFRPELSEEPPPKKKKRRRRRPPPPEPDRPVRIQSHHEIKWRKR